MQLYSVYYISVGSSTCFVCWQQTLGARTTVITASGTGQPGLLPPALVCWVEDLMVVDLVDQCQKLNYSCTSSWCLLSTHETCRSAYRNIINWIQLYLVGQLLNLKMRVVVFPKVILHADFFSVNLSAASPFLYFLLFSILLQPLKTLTFP